jgi:hypothetical protein
VLWAALQQRKFDVWRTLLDEPVAAQNADFLRLLCRHCVVDVFLPGRF